MHDRILTLARATRRQAVAPQTFCTVKIAKQATESFSVPLGLTCFIVHTSLTHRKSEYGACPSHFKTLAAVTM